jgi:purine nucleosidase/pyrimidine-specific ribonucleoside hydrolase
MPPVILDCDPGHDDAIALLLALGSPEVDLLGVTTVAGNQTLDKTTANAIRVLDHVGRADVPVAAGANRPLTRDLQTAPEVHGETGLDGSRLPPPAREPEPEHAIDWIARTVLEAAEPVTLVPVGPLTNIALLLARHPEVEDRLGPVVLMGGAIAEGNQTPAAEFNMWVDPEAAHRVFSSRLAITMVGLDVTYRALMTPAHADRLAVANRAGKLISDMYAFYGAAYRRYRDWPGAPIHDAVAMAYVIDPTLLEVERAGVAVDTGPEPSRGRTYVDRRHRPGWDQNADVAVGVDDERLLELVVDRISSLP